MAMKLEQNREVASMSATSDMAVVCACADLKLGELKRLLAGEGCADFDRLLESTGAGKTCTACLLDLEYYFASCHAANSSPTAIVQDETPRLSERSAGLKAWLYAALDRLPLRVAVVKTEWMPVLIGDRVEQNLLIANHSLLYKTTAAATIRVKILVRDADGVERHHEHMNLREGEVLKRNLSQYLSKLPTSGSSNGLGVGSVMISRKALRRGMWGTTRPQVEIVTPRAACVVHSQGPSGQREQWFSCLHRPDHERIFYSVVNVRNKPLEVETTCYLGSGGTAMHEVVGERFVVPASGVRLCEVGLPMDLRGSSSDHALLHLRWRCSGPRKLHIFCSDSNLSRFSIDHL